MTLKSWLYKITNDNVEATYCQSLIYSAQVNNILAGPQCSESFHVKIFLYVKLFNEKNYFSYNKSPFFICFLPPSFHISNHCPVLLIWEMLMNFSSKLHFWFNRYSKNCSNQGPSSSWHFQASPCYRLHLWETNGSRVCAIEIEFLPLRLITSVSGGHF